MESGRDGTKRRRRRAKTATAPAAPETGRSRAASEGEGKRAASPAAIVQGAAIIGQTLDGIVTSWNPGAEKLFGYSSAEITGGPISLIEPPGLRKEMEEILGRIRRGEGVEHYHAGRLRKDGRIVQVSLTVSPIRDEKGHIAGASLIAHEVRGQGDRAARFESPDPVRELALALDLVPAMVRKLDGEILLWGRGNQALYGWPAEEAVGRIAHDLLATEFPMPLQEIHDELLSAGTWHGELVRTHRDGRRLVVAAQWALYWREGEDAVSVFEFNSDITEAKRTQAMLEEREARLRSILETGPDAIITIDERGIIQYFNSAATKLFGYSPGEVIGRNVKLLMPSPYRENHDGYIARYLRTGERRIIGIGRQVEARRKNGTLFPVQLAVGEVVLGDAHIFTGFVSDLTARVKMEQELRHAQKMEAIGQLTGGVAHDFNNLLTIISGNLEMLERRLTEREHRELLGEAQEATKLGAELANRLLAFGRRQPLNPKPTDISTLVSGMGDLLRRSLGEAIEIELRLPKALPAVMADPGQVENALLNLALNARDAMPNGGRLIIEAMRAELDEDYAAHADVVPGKYVCIAVTDTGTGMTPEASQRAFEPFYTTKGPGVGSGLGLSMVYGFVKQSGGHVKLYSEPGVGTTVRLYLPECAIETPAELTPTAPAPRTKAGGTVLVVEDDRRVRRVTVRRLRELGYSVIEADSGPAALLMLDRTGPIDVLFTDVVMPGGMTGVDLAHEVRQRRPGLKILLTSGYAEPEAITGGLLAGNVAWLGKPYSINELDAKLHELLG